MKQLLDVERIGNRTHYWWKHWDDGEKKITLQTYEDVQSTLDANKRAYNDAPKRFENPVNKIASIPFNVVEHFCKINKISFSEMQEAKSDRAQKMWNRLLNDPDLRNFRTRPGYVDFKQG